MGKLRYKDKEKEDRKSEKEEKRSKKRNKEDGSYRNKDYYRSPHLYEVEEGWTGQEDISWTEHLFEAMMEDEGEDPFYSSYKYDSFEPTGKTAKMSNELTEEEYRQYIVDGMYEKKHHEQIKAREKWKAKQERKERKKKMANDKIRKEEEERMRSRKIYEQLEALNKNKNRRKEYEDKWLKLDSAVQINKDDIPWPSMSSKISLTSLRSFIIDSTLTTSENMKNLRKEQMRYHPDKFISKVVVRLDTSEGDKQNIIKKMNEVSSLLNELWAQMK
ncbi:hypothetical protein BDB01DRAFT_841787 [Pilobolus umbonatus]|nr:hypothetical protein BDB01DRAFT_841787 [Pilobolus umbonatus]